MRLLPPACLAVCLAACSGSELQSLVVTQSEVVPTTHAVSWLTATPGRSWVEFEVDGVERAVEPSAEGTVHEVRLAGLKPGRTYSWRAFTDVGTRVLRSAAQTLEVPPLPATMPPLTLSEEETGSLVAEGYVLTSIIELEESTGGGWMVIVDGDGDIVWWFDTGHVGALPADLVGRVPSSWSGRSLPLSSAFDADTQTLTFSAYDLDQRLLVGVARHLPLHAMTADEVVLTRLPDGHHDFAMVDGGATVAYLAYQVDTIDGDRWAADAVLEIPTGTPDQRDIERVWSWFDDGPAAPEVTNPLQRTFSYDIAQLEWTHSNSLMASGDAYFVMSKFLDCLVKIDRASGRTEWIMGGPFSDFALSDGTPAWEGLEDSQLWSHAHMSDLWYDAATGTGGFTVFDNGTYRATEVAGRSSWSRLAEFSFDEGARTVREEWSYTPDSGLYTTLLGDLDKLADDRWLASWSRLRARGLEEVDASGTPQWRVQLPDDSALFGRAQYLDTMDTR